MIEQAQEFEIFDTTDGGVVITIGQTPVWYASDFEEANMMLTMIEGMPKIITLSTWMSKALSWRSDQRRAISPAPSSTLELDAGDVIDGEILEGGDARRDQT